MQGKKSELIRSAGVLLGLGAIEGEVWKDILNRGNNKWQAQEETLKVCKWHVEALVTGLGFRFEAGFKGHFKLMHAALQPLWCCTRCKSHLQEIFEKIEKLKYVYWQ